MLVPARQVAVFDDSSQEFFLILAAASLTRTVCSLVHTQHPSHYAATPIVNHGVAGTIMNNYQEPLAAISHYQQSLV